MPDRTLNPDKIARAARAASVTMAQAPTGAKNRALATMAKLLDQCRGAVAQANEADMESARSSGLDEHLVERLRFGEPKIDSRIRCLGKIEALPDPVGQPFQSERRPNGLEVARVRVPLGVILMIYEARPHVTVNAGAFCLKSGNAAILRGGSEAVRCNALLGDLWRTALEDAGLPADAVRVVSGTHEDIAAFLAQEDSIDLVIPRGGKSLIESVAVQSRIPVLKHFAGNCHLYIDASADLQKACDIAIDSKCLMPEVCNALESVLVARSLGERISAVVEAFHKAGVRVRGCRDVQALARDVEPADEDDWGREYLDMVVSMRAVEDVGEAIEHINRYGSHHTDSIATGDLGNARRFLREVDSGVVLVNASTMFCDGESLGMGAEIGISTDKLHARGPMGLEDLTTYKFTIVGDGHVMGGA